MEFDRVPSVNNVMTIMLLEQMDVLPLAPLKVLINAMGQTHLEPMELSPFVRKLVVMGSSTPLIIAKLVMTTMLLIMMDAHRLV